MYKLIIGILLIHGPHKMNTFQLSYVREYAQEMLLNVSEIYTL